MTNEELKKEIEDLKLFRHAYVNLMSCLDDIKNQDKEDIPVALHNLIESFEMNYKRTYNEETGQYEFSD